MKPRKSNYVTVQTNLQEPRETETNQDDKTIQQKQLEAQDFTRQGNKTQVQHIRPRQPITKGRNTEKVKHMNKHKVTGNKTKQKNNNTQTARNRRTQGTQTNP